MNDHVNVRPGSFIIAHALPGTQTLAPRKVALIKSGQSITRKQLQMFQACVITLIQTAGRTEEKSLSRKRHPS